MPFRRPRRIDGHDFGSRHSCWNSYRAHTSARRNSSNIPSNKRMKMTSLLVGGYPLLPGGAFAGDRVGVADIKTTFARPLLAPVADPPKGALYPPGFDSVEHGALTNI